MLISKKDVISINQEIGESGAFQNESSLDFVLDLIKSKKSWLYELGQLVRAMLIDHVFVDGNKRTSFILIHAYIEENGLEADKELIESTILYIIKNNVRDINDIMRLIRRCYHHKK